MIVEHKKLVECAYATQQQTTEPTCELRRRGMVPLADFVLLMVPVLVSLAGASAGFTGRGIRLSRGVDRTLDGTSETLRGRGKVELFGMPFCLLDVYGSEVASRRPAVSTASGVLRGVFTIRA